MRFKKFLFIVLIFVIIAVGAALYFYFTQPQKEEITKEAAEKNKFTSYLKTDPLARELFPVLSKTTDISAPLLIKKVKGNKIYAPKIYNQFIYYLSEDGRLFKESFTGEEKINLLSLYSFKIQNLEIIKWNLPNYFGAFLSSSPKEYGTNDPVEELWMDIDAVRSKIIYNLENESSIVLADNIEDFIWEKDGEGMYYYIYNETEKKNIIFKANNEGKNAKEITKIPGEKVYFAENTQKIKSNLYFLQYSEKDGANILLELNLLNNQPQTILSGVNTVNFSLDDKYFLANNTKNKHLSTFLFGLQTKRLIDLTKQFLVEKAIFNNNIIYFILGENVNYGSSENPNYIGTYTFWKYDVSSNEFTQLTNLSKSRENLIDPVDMELVGDKIYFTNLQDQAFYALELR